MTAGAALLKRGPRRFRSLREAAADVVGLCLQAPDLVAVYRRGVLDPALRERIMVAVSHANACAGCTAVHERWALRAGVSTEDLEALGLGNLARLDQRSRCAVVYATALAEQRFRGVPDPGLVADVLGYLTADELRAVEAVARIMAVANLSVNTLHHAYLALVRTR